MGEDRFVIRKTDFVPQKEMLLRDRIFEGDPDAPEVADLLRRCRGQAEPAAVVKLVEVTHDGEGRVTAVGGESMSGPVLDRQLKDIHRAFAFIATTCCMKQSAAPVMIKISDAFIAAASLSISMICIVFISFRSECSVPYIDMCIGSSAGHSVPLRDLVPLVVMQRGFRENSHRTRQRHLFIDLLRP